jgi:flavin-dependent dehydrogenase
MAKSAAPQPDVLVLGQHPCAYLAAELLVHKHGLTAAHATLPGERVPDRLVLLNPQFFALHKPLEKLKKKLELTAVHGVSFLSDEPQTRGEWRAKSVVAYVACYSDIRKQLAALLKDAGAKLMTPKSVSVARVDEKGFELLMDRHHAVRPRAVLLAGEAPDEMARAMGLADAFPADEMRRYSFLRLRGGKWTDLGPKPLLPMSLDLDRQLTWAWLLPGVDEVQLAVEQPLNTVSRIPPRQLMGKWAEVLRRHGVLKSDEQIPLDAIESIDVPAGGALSREIVANRTLLFGPAGGFYSASLEDLYPNCWSAVFAADAVCQALKERHLQDALQPYRQQWGATLGEYLRGPQQNLRFLLPLVYRNPVMTARMAESILQGKSVVR